MLYRRRVKSDGHDKSAPNSRLPDLPGRHTPGALNGVTPIRTGVHKTVWRTHYHGYGFESAWVFGGSGLAISVTLAWAGAQVDGLMALVMFTIAAGMGVLGLTALFRSAAVRLETHADRVVMVDRFRSRVVRWSDVSGLIAVIESDYKPGELLPMDWLEYSALEPRLDDRDLVGIGVITKDGDLVLTEVSEKEAARVLEAGWLAWQAAYKGPLYG